MTVERHLSRLLRAAGAVLIAAALAACGGSDDPTPAGGQATIGAAGGTLDGPAGSRVVVPAGALAASATLSIAVSSSGAPPLPPGGLALGETFELTPHGTAFAAPATLRIPFDPSLVPAGAAPVLMKTNAAQTGWETVAGATVAGAMMEGQIGSFSWTIVVVPPTLPTISVQPLPQSVVAPAPATFVVGATGPTLSGVLSFQWKRNGVAIVGASGASYTTGPSSVAADDGAVYSVDVTNLAGRVTSADATLSVTAAVVPPGITLQPVDATVAVGGSATFVVAVSGTTPIVQWRRSNDGGASYADIPGANAASLSVANAQPGDSGARFLARVSNGAGMLDSSAAILTVTATPPPPTGSATISAGDDYTLAVTVAGAVYSWGSDGSAQLGNGAMNGDRPTPEAIASLTGVRSASAGEGHGIAVLADGSAWAWGYGGYIDCTAGAVHSSPVQIAASGIVAASAGASHSLLLRADGVVLSIGCNFEGELGRAGTVPPQSPAAAVPGLPTIVAVAAGSGYSLALDSAGFVWAWGKAGVRADTSAFGDAPRATPMQVQGINSVVAIAAGSDHALALRSNGLLAAWGRNDSGELGDGTTTFRGFPASTLLTSGITAIAAGEGSSLAVRSGGAVLSWGRNSYGQLGTGSTSPFFRPTPEVVAGIVGAVAVAMGQGRVHAMALRSDGTVWSWGNNGAGQLGDGSTFDRFTPGPVPGLDLD